MAESTRAELASAVHPADNPAGGELVGGAFDQGRVVQRLDRLPVLPRRSRQLPRVHWWAPERMVGHVAIWVVEVHPIGIQRRAQGAAGIARSGRNEYARETRLREDPRVGEAVQRDATAKTQIRQAALLMECARDVHEPVFEDLLNARRAVGEPPAFVCLEIDGLVWMSRCPEQVDEPRRIRPRGGGLVLEELRREREPAVGRAANQRPYAIDHRRMSIRRETHHLVLVFVYLEAEIRGKGRVQQAERMGIPDLA